MPMLGYKPAGNARGAGVNAAGRARVTYLGAFSTNVWVTQVGARMGRSGASNAIAAPVFYSQASANSAPDVLFYAPAPKTIATLMTNDRATGLNYQWSVTNFPLAAGSGVGGGVWADDAGGGIMYGQNASGKRLYRDDTAPSVPSPFGVTSFSAEGDIDVWIEGVSNRQPVARITSPQNGAVTTDPRPQIEMNWSDSDYPLGDGFQYYRVEFWNTQGTVKHHDSGIVTRPDPDTSHWETYTPNVDLPYMTYQVRVTVYDKFGWGSPQATITLNVVAGGSFVNSELDPSAVEGTEQQGALLVPVTNSATPGVEADWTHTTGLSTQEFRYRIRDYANVIAEALGGAVEVYREERSALATVNPGQTVQIQYPVQWADLAPGFYVWEVRAFDTDDNVSAWTQIPFVMNASPSFLSQAPIDNTTRADYPSLEATVADDDDAGSHAVTMYIRPDGGSYTGYAATYVGSGLYRLQTTATHLPSRQTYQWYPSAVDPWGLAGTGAVNDLFFVDPPDLTNVFPDNETIITGTPTIYADVDRTITSYRLIIKAQGGQRVYWDSGLVNASGASISHAVPSKTLYNATDYDLIISLQASDGLSHVETFPFRLEYVPDPALVTTVQTVHSSIYDVGGIGVPEQLPNVDISWTPPTTTVVPDEDWQRYVIQWVPDNPDYVTETWTIDDRNTPGMTDTRVPGNTPGTYRVYYERWVNDGFDTITSDPVEVEITALVRYTTITSEHPDDPAVTLHFWENREIGAITSTTAVEILGQQRPDAWSSPLHYKTISGEFRVVDDDSGMNLYTAEDIIRDLEILSTPVIAEPTTVDLVIAALDRVLGYGGVDPSERYLPRVLWYRDPKGNAFRFTIQTVTFPHEHLGDRARARLTGFEVHDGS